jgi:hypothetical protein
MSSLAPQVLGGICRLMCEAWLKYFDLLYRTADVFIGVALVADRRAREMVSCNAAALNDDITYLETNSRRQ